jgi:hypothetical protein
MLRYDVRGEQDFHDDFGWLDITHGMTYANAARWHLNRVGVTPELIGLVAYVAWLAQWTGRHEWHTAVGDRHAPAWPEGVEEGDLTGYGRALQRESLLDGTTAAIVHAHAVKMSVAGTEEAQRLGRREPLDAVPRFLRSPKNERFVASSVIGAIDHLSGRAPRD